MSAEVGNPFVVDLEREEDMRGTGIFVRARRSGDWVNADIAHLDKDSLDRWLRSRNSIDWPIGVVMLLLEHRR